MESRIPKKSLVDLCKLKNSWIKEGLAEFLGTFILILFGCGSIAQSVLSRGVSGNMLTSSIGFPFGVTIGVYATIGVSGAHLNPAISLSMCVLGRLQWLKLPIYCFAQFVGAFLGSAAVFGLYYDAFMAFDGGNLAITGQNATAQIFSSYPAAHLTFANGFADQIVGTAALLFSILAILDSKNDRVPKGLEPVVIGLIILVIGLSMGFNCGGPINPARDLGPRLFTAVAGWGIEVFRMSKQAWGTITPAPFPHGRHRMTALQIQQMVERLHGGKGVGAPRSGYQQHIRQAEAEFARRHKALTPEGLKQLLDRLTDNAAEKASDRCRVPQGKVRDIGILNSYAWKGWN